VSLMGTSGWCSSSPNQAFLRSISTTTGKSPGRSRTAAVAVSRCGGALLRQGRRPAVAMRSRRASREGAASASNCTARSSRAPRCCGSGACAASFSRLQHPPSRCTQRSHSACAVWVAASYPSTVSPRRPENRQAGPGLRQSPPPDAGEPCFDREGVPPWRCAHVPRAVVGAARAPRVHAVATSARAPRGDAVVGAARAPRAFRACSTPHRAARSAPTVHVRSGWPRRILRPQWALWERATLATVPSALAAVPRELLG